MERPRALSRLEAAVSDFCFGGPPEQPLNTIEKPAFSMRSALGRIIRVERKEYPGLHRQSTFFPNGESLRTSGSTTEIHYEVVLFGRFRLGHIHRTNYGQSVLYK